MFRKVIGFLKDALASPPASGLSQADIAAIGKDLALAAGKDAALAKALLAYVVSGTPESALLGLQAVPARERLVAYDGDYHNYGVKNERAKGRARIFVSLSGWDAAALKRFGEVLAICVEDQKTYTYYTNSPPWPYWPKWLSALGRGYVSASQAPIADELGIFSLPRLVEFLALDHMGTTELLLGLFGQNIGWSYSGTPKALISKEALTPLADAEPQAFAKALGQMDTDARTKFVAKIAEIGRIGVEPILDAVLPMAADHSKIARAAAMAALQNVEPGLLRAKAAAMLQASASDTRLAGVRILAALVGPGTADHLKAHAAGEKSKKIVQAIDEALSAFAVLAGGATVAAVADNAGGYVSVDGKLIIPPPRKPVEADRLLPPEAVAILRQALIAQTAHNKQESDAHRAAHPDVKRSEPQSFNPEHAAIVIRILNGEAVSGSDMKLTAQIAERANQIWHGAFVADAFDKIFALPVASLHHAVRMVQWKRLLSPGSVHQPQWILAGCRPAARYLGQRLAGGLDLRLIADALETGQGGSLYLPELLRQDYTVGGLFEYGELDTATIWPWIAERFAGIDDLMARILNLAYNEPDPLLFLSLLPAPPRRYLQALTDIAVTGTKDSRDKAKAALAKSEALTPLIAGLLKSGEQSRRVAAANWLAERGDAAALPALREAIASERGDRPRAAILSAMAALGEDISRFFADDVLLAEAKKALPKLKSKLGDWLPDSAIPAVAWADGRPVPRDIIRYWLLLSDKLKMPGGNPMLDIGLDRLKRDDAARLGLTILAAFIDYDSAHPTEAAANAYAQANASARYQGTVQWVKDYTPEKAFADLKREMQGTYLHSASEHRGILALAIRAPGADAARLAKAFLKDNTARTSQCRALLECLAANPSPAAVQLVLAVSRRHKTPGVQKHAGDLVLQISENNNWTPQELSDRTVPTAGFDEDASMELEIGGKMFRALLDSACKIVLENPDGKVIAALPSPSGEAEAEQASAARKLVANARKEIKQTVEMQTAQLYEAMCGARIWKTADFELFILRHPVLGRLVARLVFAGLDEAGSTQATFRVLDDRSLTGSADQLVDLAAFSGIRVAHAALLDQAGTAAWQAHLKDYEVAALFEQFGRPVLALTPGIVEDNSIIDRRGYMIETFKLRGIATKLGYQRGQAEDGGVFTHYQKRFQSAGITALVDFTGAALPEENVAAAITGLRFSKLGNGSSWGKALPPSGIAPVLLSEVWNDVHRMAEQGSGFAADWQKKAYF